MPKRMINSKISKSDKLAYLSPKALCLFLMLIPHFNAHGKMNGEPHFIKGQICPKINWLNLNNIPDILQEISRHTNIKWFRFEGLYYLHSLNWKIHQPGLKRLGQDELPNYMKYINSPDSPRTVPGQSQPEVEVNGLREKGEVEVDVKTLAQKNGAGRFEEFWKAYPRKKSKGQAIKAWNTLNPDLFLFDQIMNAIKKAINSSSWKKDNGQFIPYPATWIRARGWEDEYNQDKPLGLEAIKALREKEGRTGSGSV